MESRVIFQNMKIEIKPIFYNYILQLNFWKTLLTQPLKQFTLSQLLNAGKRKSDNRSMVWESKQQLRHLKCFVSEEGEGCQFASLFLTCYCKI